MENPTARELIFNELKEKAILKQDVYNNLKLNFKVMKTVLKEMADNLQDRMKSQDERVKIEYRERGEYEAHLQFAGDILIFQMHSAPNGETRIAPGFAQILWRGCSQRSRRNHIRQSARSDR